MIYHIKRLLSPKREKCIVCILTGFSSSDDSINPADPKRQSAPGVDALIAAQAQDRVGALGTLNVRAYTGLNTGLGFWFLGLRTPPV